MSRLKRRALFYSALLLLLVANEASGAGIKEIARVFLIALISLSILWLVGSQYIAEKKHRRIPESAGSRDAVIRAVSQGKKAHFS